MVDKVASVKYIRNIRTRRKGMNLFIKGFDSSLHHRLKVLAAQRQITLKRLVELLLSEALLKGKKEGV